MREPGGRPRSSLSGLVMRLVDDSVLLVRSEFRLVFGEFSLRLTQAAGNIALVLFGAMLLGMALLFLLTGLLVWLASHVGMVAAALIAAAIAIILGAATVHAGLKRLRAGEHGRHDATTGNPDDNDARRAGPAQGD
jgi:hypothetical protein